MEGDDMGVEKIANALHDPVANTWDPDTAKSFSGDSDGDKGPRKRKASDDDEQVVAKKVKHGSSTEEEAEDGTE
ncbi:hypothetical protein LTS01_026162, partial [Friedmanniomyces endolithicus]